MGGGELGDIGAVVLLGGRRWTFRRRRTVEGDDGIGYWWLWLRGWHEAGLDGKVDGENATRSSCELSRSRITCPEMGSTSTHLFHAIGFQKQFTPFGRCAGCTQ